MPETAVVRAASLVLAHTPGLARHGSKPMRTLTGDADLTAGFLANLRSFDDAVGYPPHQAFLGACHPRDLPSRPWIGAGFAGAERFGPFGELMPEEEFLGVMAAVDEFDLLVLTPEVAEQAAKPGRASAGGAPESRPGHRSVRGCRRCRRRRRPARAPGWAT